MKMTFAEAVQSGLKNAFKFVGLAGRREYWFFQLFCALVGIVVSTLDGLLFPIPADAPMQQQLLGTPLTWVFNALLFFPQLSMLGRRLRDVGFSARWLWLWVGAFGFAMLATFAILSVEDAGQTGTVDGNLNSLGYLYPTSLIAGGILLFFFIVSLQPSKSGQQGNKYAPGYDATRDPKSDDFAGGDDWQPKL